MINTRKEPGVVHNSAAEPFELLYAPISTTSGSSTGNVASRESEVRAIGASTSPS